MTTDRVNIDDFVDYKAEYTAALAQAKVTGEALKSLCPFHDDKNPSFSVNLKNGTYKCHACGAAGNYITFVAETEGISQADAMSRILRKYGRETEPDEPAGYTVEDYAAEKDLPIELLRELGLVSKKERSGRQYVEIPYYDEDGKITARRKRYHKSAGKRRFAWVAGARLRLYDERRLPELRKGGKVLMVEGESDTHALMALGLPVLGVPGASSFKVEWVTRLGGIKAIYAHHEGDHGADVFFETLIRELKAGGYGGKLYRWSCRDIGVKDPSDAYTKYGAEADAKIRGLLNAATEIDLAEAAEAEELKEYIPGQPIRLRQPPGYSYTAEGIWAADTSGNGDKTLICRTPVLISGRLCSAQSLEEKIVLAFLRDGKWHEVTQARSAVFQSRGITGLADYGVTVTSENARFLVRYLERLEAANIDLIPKHESVSNFGWMSGGRFMPSAAPGVVLDVDPSLASWAAAYTSDGTLAEWVAMTAPHRERWRFRFILAAAFTAPLLRMLQQRILFVYNWGDSKGGKSAALKAALSAWGDPARIVANFNATQVALERMAGFYCDLPLGIDERQLAGDNQEMLDRVIYMLTSGTGRARGGKAGGLQTLQTWRTVVLTTGEEPLIADRSQTGVSTRVLEIYGGPFDDERAASDMHRQCERCYGTAGAEFIRRLVETDEADVRRWHDQWLDVVRALSEGKNGAHDAGIAAVAVADQLLCQWLYGEDLAEQGTAEMIRAVVDADRENAARDVNLTAVEWLHDWMASNARNFGRDVVGVPKYGEFGKHIDDGDVAYIYPAVMRDALRAAGFAPKKTTRFMLERGLLQTNEAGRDTCIKRFDGGQCARVYAVKIDAMLDLLGVDKAKAMPERAPERVQNPTPKRYGPNGEFEEITVSDKVFPDSKNDELPEFLR